MNHNNIDDLINKPTLALVVMMKNEEANIGRCIKSIKSIVDEIICVDTGSEDKSIEIAESLGAKIIHYPWVNDYSEPRNIGLRSVKSEWIQILDADEYFSERDLKFIKYAIKNKNIDAYRMHKRSYVYDLNFRNTIPRPENDTYEESNGFAGWIVEPVDCLFKNDPRIYYSYNIHESVGRSLAEYKRKVVEIDIPIHHTGRYDMDSKSQKYLNMIKRRAEIYNDGESFYYLGTHLDWFQESEEALKYFKKSYEILKDTYSLYGISLSLLKLKKYNDAIGNFEKLLKIEPGQNPAWGNLMECYFNTSNFRMMRETYERALEFNPNNINVIISYAKIQIRRNIMIDARDKIREALKINPTNIEVKNLLKLVEDIY